VTELLYLAKILYLGTSLYIELPSLEGDEATIYSIWLRFDTKIELPGGDG
jgi:hypothetical protein